MKILGITGLISIISMIIAIIVSFIVGRDHIQIFLDQHPFLRVILIIVISWWLVAWSIIQLDVLIRGVEL